MREQRREHFSFTAMRIRSPLIYLFAYVLRLQSAATLQNINAANLLAAYATGAHRASNTTTTNRLQTPPIIFASNQAATMLKFVEKMLGALKAQHDDDQVDRANNLWTPLLCASFAILMAAKQYVGEPLQCWAPAEFKVSARHANFDSQQAIFFLRAFLFHKSLLIK